MIGFKERKRTVPVIKKPTDVTCPVCWTESGLPPTMFQFMNTRPCTEHRVVDAAEDGVDA